MYQQVRQLSISQKLSLSILGALIFAVALTALKQPNFSQAQEPITPPASPSPSPSPSVKPSASVSPVFSPRPHSIPIPSEKPSIY